MAPEIGGGRYDKSIDIYALERGAVRAAHRPAAVPRRNARRDPDEARLVEPDCPASTSRSRRDPQGDGEGPGRPLPVGAGDVEAVFGARAHPAERLVLQPRRPEHDRRARRARRRRRRRQRRPRRSRRGPGGRGGIGRRRRGRRRPDRPRSTASATASARPASGWPNSRALPQGAAGRRPGRDDSSGQARRRAGATVVQTPARVLALDDAAGVVGGDGDPEPHRRARRVDRRVLGPPCSARARALGTVLAGHRILPQMSSDSRILRRIASGGTAGAAPARGPARARRGRRRRGGGADGAWAC